MLSLLIKESSAKKESSWSDFWPTYSKTCLSRTGNETIDIVELQHQMVKALTSLLLTLCEKQLDIHGCRHRSLVIAKRIFQFTDEGLDTSLENVNKELLCRRSLIVQIDYYCYLLLSLLEWHLVSSTKFYLLSSMFCYLLLSLPLETICLKINNSESFCSWTVVAMSYLVFK